MVDYKHIRVGSRDIRFIERGKGDPVLYLHSVFLAPHLSSSFFDHLVNNGRTIIAPHLYGYAHLKKSPYKIDDFLCLTQSFINKIGLSSYSLVGSSYGGGGGLKIASGNTAVQKTVFINPIVETKKNSWQIFSSFLKTGIDIQKIAKADYFFEKAEITGNYEGFWEDQIPPIRHAIKFLLALKDISEFSLNGAKIDCPSLLLYGDTDKTFPLKERDFDKLRTHINNLEISVLHGRGGHWDVFQDQQLAASLTSEFLLKN